MMLRGWGFWGRVAVAGLVLALGGCVPETSNTSTDGNVGVDPAAYPGERVRGEPNDTFNEPITIVLNPANRGHLAGTISSTADVDVYVFKTLLPGDRVILDVGTSNNGLDAAVAVYDEGGRIAFENDDRSLSPMQIDPYLNQVVRRESLVYFLAVYRSPLAVNSRVGAYEVLVTVVPGGQVPAGEGQTVVLDFDGGSISLPERTYTVGAFNTADISPLYSGMTAVVRSQVAATVRDNYEGLSLDVRTVPGDTVPTGAVYSTVLFGGTSPDAFGESQAIDSYNSNQDDQAIVFTGMFTPSQFGRVLTALELGTAVGNIASHELGHLLGLNHVADVDDVMDTTGDSSTLLRDVRFLNSPLHWTIAPLGTQDSFLLLLEALGGGW
ncbi:MAG TPA: hypothetical protein VLM89_09945 [Phycisphaerae bacterium]|nr:hypothetical protein [Phycisphaerae bacterium]